MSKKNKNRSDIFKNYFREHPGFDADYNANDTFGNLSLDSLMPDMEQPLSVEDETLFENVGGENYIPSDASDISENNDIDVELMGLTEELSKRIPNNTSQQSDRHPTENADEISNQIESAIAKEKPTQAPPTPNKPLSRPRSAEKKVNLYDMRNDILRVNTLIRHDEGLYYYNGKCYLALRNDLKLLELIRTKVSFSAFAATSTKPFQDLMMFLKTDPELIPNNYEKKLEKARRLVALNNGVLDISKLELLDFDPKYLLFHHIDASWTKYQYPKVFLKFLRQSCNYDEEVVRLTAEAIGYLISGSNQAKAFFVIGTAPDSGKSTLASLITKLLGEEYTCSIEPNKLHERFSLGSTRGKILNMAMDIPQGRLCSAAVSKIKAITGQDSISIEEKYMRMEHTVSTLRFLFGTNHPITLSQTDSDDDAFWNRMHVIPFQRSVPSDKKDPTLLDKLWSERDAIVSYCLRSYQTVLNNGYTFSPCQASEDMKASWRREDISTVSFANFWQDYVKVTGDLNDQIYSQVLYEKYSFYCQDRGIDPVYYTKMREWIEAHTDPDMCVAKRLHRTGQNPRAGYCGIKVHY